MLAVQQFALWTVEPQIKMLERRDISAAHACLRALLSVDGIGTILADDVLERAIWCFPTLGYLPRTVVVSKSTKTQ